MRKQSSIELREREVQKRIEEHKYEARLYHYTSIASLIGIFSTAACILSTILIQNAVSEDIAPEKRDICNAFFDKLYSRLKNEYPFAASFSTLKDNAAQWERYADNAHGACIVFNTSRLLNLFWYSGAWLHEVFYQ